MKTKHHTIFHHHEDPDTFKARFSKHVSDLTTGFEQPRNPFLADEAAELIQLGTRGVMGPGVSNMVRTIENPGISQHKKFRENRIIKKTKGYMILSQRTNCPYSNLQIQEGTEIKEMKLQVRLFPQMYIFTQIRGGDMDQFFSHKTLKYPPALTKCGDLRHGEKSDLLKCLQPTPPKSHLPSVFAAALEEFVLANMMKLKKNHTFVDYCSEMLNLQLQHYTREYDAQRIDVVFDTYKQVNLKSSARTKRGKGIRYKVQVNSVTLTN